MDIVCMVLHDRYILPTFNVKVFSTLKRQYLKVVPIIISALMSNSLVVGLTGVRLFMTPDLLQKFLILPW